MLEVRLLKRAAGFVLLATLAACSPRTPDSESPGTSASGNIAIVPLPREIIPRPGGFPLTGDTPIVYSGDEAKHIAEYFRELTGNTLDRTFAAPRSAGESAQGIHFRLVPGDAMQGEYSLAVSRRGIVIEATTAGGLFYGAVTLWQLLTEHSNGDATIELPALEINDAPRFGWRGLMIDSARHYQSPEFIKRFIDWMALHKLNVLHWHLTDDQAWRLEIKRYPKLTEVAAWRVPAGEAPAANLDPQTGKPKLYGGYYSQDEVREIVAYAKARFVTVVPEIEMPGHASAAIVAYPQLATAKPLTSVPADWGVYHNVYNIEDSTFEFLQNVLLEVMELFPSEYIHVGGDEAVKEQWQQSPRVQAQMKALRIESEAALQSYFIQRIEKFLNQHGRRLIGWDEILEGGLAPNATVMSWRGIEGAVAAAKMGHDTVLSPGPTLYFDNRQFADDRSPGRGKLVSLEDVYAFDPAPKEIPEAQRKHILGLQANLWSEHIRSESRLEYMAFPRAAALAEVAWSTSEDRDYDGFIQRMQTHEQRLSQLGIRYARPRPVQQDHAGLLYSHDLVQCSDNISLSLEDDAPIEGERPAFLVDIMNPCWIYPRVDLSQGASVEVTAGQVPFNFQIGKAIEEVQFQRGPLALRIHLKECTGEVIKSVTILRDPKNFALTSVPRIQLDPMPGEHDLCFAITQPRLDPLWVVHSIQIEKSHE